MLNKKDIHRFWSFVERSNNRKCWNWKGGINSTGRGIFWLKNSTPKAHRVSWMINVGKIPNSLCILHKCDNGMCVNPKHLFLGTRKDNTHDMIKKGRHIGNTKIFTKEAIKIRKEYKLGLLNGIQLAKKYMVAPSTIYQIINNKRKIHG